MTDKEQIICKYKFQDKEKFDGKPYCTCFNELCKNLSFVCDQNCIIYEDYKQLVRKTQECEQIKEKYEALKLENQEGYEIVAELTQECEELRSECGELFNAKLEILRDLDHYKRAYYGCSKRIEEHLVIRAPLPPPEFVDSRYRKALEEIEEMIKISTKDFNHIDWEAKASHALTAIDKIFDIINKAKGERNV